MKHFFNKAIQEDGENVTDQSTGAIELLIGAEVARCLPHRIEAVDNLVVIKFEFWSAYAMVGIMFQVKFTEWSQPPRSGGALILCLNIRRSSCTWLLGTPLPSS